MCTFKKVTECLELSKLMLIWSHGDAQQRYDSEESRSEGVAARGADEVFFLKIDKMYPHLLHLTLNSLIISMLWLNGGSTDTRT